MDNSSEDYTILAVVPGASTLVPGFGIVEAQIVLDTFASGPTVWQDWFLADLTACAIAAARWGLDAGRLLVPGAWIALTVDKHPGITLRLEAIPDLYLAAYATMTRH